MRELLADLDLLREPVLKLGELRMAGVPFGAEPAAIPRERVTQVTLSPIVASSRTGANGQSEYFDAAGRQLSLALVIDSVTQRGGILHLESSISFKVDGGRIVGFALYAKALHHFNYLKNYQDFCAAFASPDRVLTRESHNELMGYTHYFFGSRKSVQWDAWGNRVSLINLGAFDGNDLFNSVRTELLMRRSRLSDRTLDQPARRPVPKWTPDPDVVRRLRKRARAGASLEELQALCGVEGVAQAVYFVRAFRVPLQEMKTLHAWAGLEHESAVAQRRELLALVRQAVAKPDVEEV